MSGSNNPQHESKSLFAEQIAARKSDVQTFFSEDWSRLRTLIMELEVDAWSEDDPAAAAQSVQDDNPAAADHNDNRTADRSKPPVRDRLSELAAQIERRLETVNGSER
jgi:hypothetical protein